MRTATLLGTTGPADNAYRSVRNADTTTILRGAPCVFNMNGTSDGFDVVQSSTAGTNKSTAYFAGVAQEDIPVGGLSDAVLWRGVANFVRCSGAVAVETTLSVNPAANNFVGGPTVATVIAVTTTGVAVLPAFTNAIATATVNGVTNVSTRVMIRG